jgi:hypothetical protein
MLGSGRPKVPRRNLLGSRGEEGASIRRRGEPPLVGRGKKQRKAGDAVSDEAEIELEYCNSRATGAAWFRSL